MKKQGIVKSDSEKIEFAKDVRIHFRCTNYKKQKIKARAKELNLSVSGYIMKLIDQEMVEIKNEL